jgi:hypothetical protein
MSEGRISVVTHIAGMNSWGAHPEGETWNARTDAGMDDAIARHGFRAFLPRRPAFDPGCGTEGPGFMAGPEEAIRIGLETWQDPEAYTDVPRDDAYDCWWIV